MDNNVTTQDLDTLIAFLKTAPRLTQSENVAAFEREWSNWLGVRYSVFVNSGSSANMISMAAMRHLYGGKEIIVPPLTWVSDISSVMLNGFTPVFVDINPRTLCMDDTQVVKAVNKDTAAVFMTHVQGFNGLSDYLLEALENYQIPLVEDVCESHGATFKGIKLGAFGLISNFSFYFAHHMSTIEGGMVCTNNSRVYETLCMLRSHGMVREAKSQKTRSQYAASYPDLSEDFIFALPGYNVRNTEIGAVIGRSQLKRLDANNQERKDNLLCFLENLNEDRYRTDFDIKGSCNYAFPLILNQPDIGLRDRVEKVLGQIGVEFRRGSSGGGNQLRQPYLRKLFPPRYYEEFPEVEHIHFYGYYIGNYPSLTEDRIIKLCHILNTL